MSSERPENARWIPASLIVLSVLALGMLLVALGVMLDLLPSWTTEVGVPGGERLVVSNKLLPIGSSVVGLVFVISIFRRWRRKGGLHLFVWGVGLAFFATGSVTESLHGLFGWHPWVFRCWYLFGAVLIAAWMGQGTMHLLAPRRVAAVSGGILLAVSFYATYKVATSRLDPVMIASAATRVTALEPWSEREVLLSAAALLHETSLDERGRVSKRLLSPLARVVGEAAAATGEGPFAAILSEQTEKANLAGTVGGRRVLLGHPEWLTANGVTPDGALALGAAAGELHLLLAVDGKAAGRLDLRPAIVFSGHVITSPGVRGLTPFFNVFGTITLIGGAIYSAWLFWAKGILRHRAIGSTIWRRLSTWHRGLLDRAGSSRPTLSATTPRTGSCFSSMNSTAMLKSSNRRPTRRDGASSTTSRRPASICPRSPSWRPAAWVSSSSATSLGRASCPEPCTST